MRQVLAVVLADRFLRRGFVIGPAASGPRRCSSAAEAPASHQKDRCRKRVPSSRNATKAVTDHGPARLLISATGSGPLSRW